MKGVILAGGTGSRLGKLTSVLNKHLVAVGEVPMIEFPLAALKKLGLEDIVVVTGAEHAGTVVQYLTKEHPEINFTYKVQKEAGGIAQALSLTENICRGHKLAVVLGDNIFEDTFLDAAKYFEKSDYGAMLFIKEVPDPERFGVVEIKDNKIISIEEKPKTPKSNLVTTGLTLYDETVFEKIKRLKPSKRGEYEIEEVNVMYLNEGRAVFKKLEKFWSDAGTHGSRKIAEDYIYSKGIENFL
ncbi:sugar phosphate nucleotidyltransferase [Candidatus Pacearchaeota archaeon]|nr:sugar phosphate nucleotidyltransferase [Candidatus Pacearchaeota archaeon]